MHSKINQFISDTFYEGKLLSALENDNQLIEVPDNHQGILNQEAGIHFIPVTHEGNTQASEEEVRIIKRLVDEIKGRAFVNKSGQKIK